MRQPRRRVMYLGNMPARSMPAAKPLPTMFSASWEMTNARAQKKDAARLADE